jgi:hypothetical protein
LRMLHLNFFSLKSIKTSKQGKVSQGAPLDTNPS